MLSLTSLTFCFRLLDVILMDFVRSVPHFPTPSQGVVDVFSTW